MERPGAQEVMLIIMVRMAIARKKIRFMRFGIKVEKRWPFREEGLDQRLVEG
jgi:hypothetical protein